MGPTASGKSAVALELARALNAGAASSGGRASASAGADPCGVELVSMDSMQVYRGMDIGTAKPSPAQQAEVPHHLIDVADPWDDWDMTRHADAVNEVVADIEGRGRRALLVGGTGLYVQAVVDRLRPPGRWPEVAAELAAEPSTARLHRRLAELDPLAASRMEPNNRRRVLRALEVTLGSGRPFSTFGPGMGNYPETSWRLAGLWLPRAVVARRIEERFDAMISEGLVQEVRALARFSASSFGLSRTARQAIGYKELFDYLDGTEALETAVASAVARTRSFARRQRVWWRRDPRVVWYGAAKNPLDIVPALLGDWREP